MIQIMVINTYITKIINKIARFCNKLIIIFRTATNLTTGLKEIVNQIPIHLIIVKIIMNSLIIQIISMIKK